MAFADLDGVRLFYTDEGSGAPTLLLVHGWTGESHDWCFQLGELSAHHRVIAPDLRGHGRSSVPEHGFGSPQLLRDLVGLLDERAVGPVVAIGHSLGGVLVSMLAVEEPDRVEAIVVVDPPYGLDEEAVRASRALGDALGSQMSATAIVERPGRLSPATPPWLVTWHRRRLLGMPPHVVRETFLGMHRDAGHVVALPAATTYLSRRRCPVLAFHADPAKAAWDASTFIHPHSEAIAWKGSGHSLHQERPLELNALVLDWVSRLPPPGER